MADIVPFGKYKGQPVEVLTGDRDYVDWLMGQAWFRERYGNVYTLIVNNFAEPSETPEHNRLQARFLDDGFCCGLLKILDWQPFANPVASARAVAEKAVAGGLAEVTAAEALADLRVGIRTEFEVRGWDAWIAAQPIGYGLCAGAAVWVEIKPALGDDYPAVLPQMKANAQPRHNGYRVLAFDQFTAAGATLDQMRAIFEASGFKVLSIAEIEAA